MSYLLDKPLREILTLAGQSNEARKSWHPVPDGEGNGSLPMDGEQVIVFLNGNVDILDERGRDGGGWGIRMGWYDADKRYWRVGGSPESYVTHWMSLPPPPLKPEEEV